MTLQEIEKYALDTTSEYPEITEDWKRLRLTGQIHQAYRFGVEDGNKTAPDLLYELKRLVKAAEELPLAHGRDMLTEELFHARAAISKAEGRP